MTKFLIGTQDGKIRSAHSDPLSFSISGRYVVDVPQDLSVLAPTDSLAELLNEKTTGIRNRPDVRALHSFQSDELLASPNVDASLSTKCFTGPNKRCAVFPGGTLVTGPLTITSLTASAYFHWYGFTLWSDQGPQPPSATPARPGPPRLLYNFDPESGSFVEFDPDDLGLEVWNAALSVKLLTAQYETVQAFVFSPGSLRLKFTNNSDKVLYLSDWIFVYG